MNAYANTILRIDGRELMVTINMSYMELLCQRSWIAIPEGEPPLEGDPEAWLKFTYTDTNAEGMKVMDFALEYDSDPYPGGTTHV